MTAFLVQSFLAIRVWRCMFFLFFFKNPSENSPYFTHTSSFSERRELLAHRSSGMYTTVTCQSSRHVLNTKSKSTRSFWLNLVRSLFFSFLFFLASLRFVFLSHSFRHQSVFIAYLYLAGLADKWTSLCVARVRRRIQTTSLVVWSSLPAFI